MKIEYARTDRGKNKGMNGRTLEISDDVSGDFVTSMTQKKLLISQDKK